MQVAGKLCNRDGNGLGDGELQGEDSYDRIADEVESVGNFTPTKTSGQWSVSRARDRPPACSSRSSS